MLVDMRPVESSENITIMDEIDELLGTRRSYGWNSGSRPSMISAKYRLKEERRKVLKISVNKMKKIDDAESSLCRSVLINNTVKRLQAETRDDRTTGRTSPASPPSPTSAGYGYHSPQQSPPCGGGPGGNPQLVDITNLRESPTNGVGGVGGVVSVGKTLQTNNNNNNNSSVNNNNKSMTDAQSSSLATDQLHHMQQQHNHHQHQHHHHQQQQQQQQHQNHHHHHHLQQHHHHQHHQSSSVPYEYDDDDDVDDDDVDDVVEDDTIASIMMQLPSSAGGKRKRPVDEPLDDLLSQFICSNSQREDEDVNVVDLDLHEYPAAKRLRTDEAAAAAAAVAAATAASTAATSTAAGSSSPSSSSPSTSSSSSSPSPSSSSVPPTDAAASSTSSSAAADLCSSDCWSLMDTCCDDTLDLYGGQVPAAVEHQDVLLPAVVAAAAAAAAAASSASTPSPTAASAADCCQLLASTSQDEHHGCYGSAPAGSTSPTSLSCGQASMFSEMQSAMFRNLIASLES